MPTQALFLYSLRMSSGVVAIVAGSRTSVAMLRESLSVQCWSLGTHACAGNLGCVNTSSFHILVDQGGKKAGQLKIVRL